MSVTGTILERRLRELSPLQAAVLRPVCKALLGPLCRSGRETGASRGAPQALDGLGRRGPMERLSHSEWALHHEIPDEFLRRWGADELLYLRVAEEAPRAPGAVEVWIDQGPATLGGARIGLAAALLTLAVEAEATGAAFAWGSLQRGRLRIGLSDGWLTELLEERSLRAPPPAGMEARRGGPAVERVYLGARIEPRAAGRRAARQVAAVVVPDGDTCDSGEAGGSAGGLRLEVAQGGDAITVVTIGLTGDSGPFLRGRAVAPSVRGSPAEARWKMSVLPSFFFCPSGCRLLLAARERQGGRQMEREAVALPVEVEAGPPRKAHRRPLEGEVRGLGWLRQQLVVLVEAKDGAHWFDHGGARRVEVELPTPLRSPMVALHRAPGEAGLFWTPPPGELRDLSRPPEPSFTLASVGHPSTQVDPGEVLFVTAEGRRATLRAVGQVHSLELMGARFTLRPDPPGRPAVPPRWLFLWHGKGEPSLRGRYAIGPGPGAAAPGNLPWPAAPGTPRGLVAVGEGAARLLLEGPDGLCLWEEGQAPMPLTRRAVVASAASPRGDCVAWLDHDGDLILYHVPAGRIIGRVERP